MEGLPTHPVVVHLPLVLAVLLPLVSGAIGYAVWKGRASGRLWAWVVAGHFVLFASAGAASLLGEADARRIQTRIDADVVEVHEAEGHRLLFASGITFALALAGLVLQRPKQRHTAMAATFAFGLACAALGVLAGRGGAVLVYQHGAAAAWSEPAPAD